jgi:hypothetical protein
MGVVELDDNADVVTKTAEYNILAQAPTNIIQAAHALSIELDTDAAIAHRYITVYILDGYGGSYRQPFTSPSYSDSYSYLKFCYTGYPAADADATHDPVVEPGIVYTTYVYIP